MKIRFVKDYDAKTATGSRKLEKRTTLDLPPDKARKLVKAGYAEPEGIIIKQITEGGRTVFVTDSEEMKGHYQKEGEAWFTEAEIKELKGVEREGLERIIDIKEAYAGSEVIKTIFDGTDLPPRPLQESSG